MVYEFEEVSFDTGLFKRTQTKNALEITSLFGIGNSWHNFQVIEECQLLITFSSKQSKMY